LIVDGTKAGFGNQLLVVSLAYRKRAIPIVWSWVKHVRGHSTGSKQIALLANAKTLNWKIGIGAMYCAKNQIPWSGCPRTSNGYLLKVTFRNPDRTYRLAKENCRSGTFAQSTCSIQTVAQRIQLAAKSVGDLSKSPFVRCHPPRIIRFLL
jgi:hypothetical protein